MIWLFLFLALLALSVGLYKQNDELASDITLLTEELEDCNGRITSQEHY